MRNEISSRARITYAATIIPVVVILDQLTKWAVLNEAQFNAIGCLDRTQRCGQIPDALPFMDLSMVWNRGMSFGFLQSEGVMRWILFAVTLAIAGAFLVWLLRAERRLTAISLAVVVAGAIGNMIDRARFGAVVDFLDFSGPWFGWTLKAQSGLFAWIDRFHTPDGVLGVGFPYVFNIADAAITLGAIALFFDQFFMSKAPKPSGGAFSAGVDNG
ncbi:MAG: signal peptidase II [Pseudomonadota bacterium]